jgi:hypothetical protein
MGDIPHRREMSSAESPISDLESVVPKQEGMIFGTIVDGDDVQFGCIGWIGRQIPNKVHINFLSGFIIQHRPVCE